MPVNINSSKYKANKRTKKL